MRRSKVRRWFFVGLFIAIGPGIFLLWFFTTASELSRERALAAKYGLIKTTTELNREQVPAAENALGDYRAASEEYRRISKTDQERVEVLADMTPAQRKEHVKSTWRPVPSQREIDVACLAYGRTFNLLRQAAAKPRYQVQVDWEREPWLAYLGDRLPLARALGVDAARQFRAGDIDGALRNLSTVRGMASHLHQTPDMGSMRRGLFMERLANERALTAAWDLRKDRAALAKVHEFLRTEPASFRFVDYLPVEILSLTWNTRMLGSDPRATGLKDDDMGPGLLPYRLSAFNQSRQAAIVRVCREYYERYQGMGRDFVSMLKDLYRTDPEKAARWQWDDLIDLYDLEPDYTYEIQVGASAQVKHRLTMAAAHLIEIYGKKGAYPAVLPDLPTVLDPFSGKPFAYSLKDRVVYSVGVDGKNGEPDARTGKPVYSTDWSLELPPKSVVRGTFGRE